jgi:hypothetical protein
LKLLSKSAGNADMISPWSPTTPKDLGELPTRYAVTVWPNRAKNQANSIKNTTRRGGIQIESVSANIIGIGG